MSTSREITTDMDAAWQSAKAIQVKEELVKGDTVVIEDDPYTFQFDGVDPTTQLAHLFREGHMDEGELAWVSRQIKVGDVVTLSNMTLAMNHHTNINLHIVNNVEEIGNI